MNNNITQVDITVLQTSQTDYNRIPAQLQMSRIVSQRGFHSVSANNYASVNGLGSLKRFSIHCGDDGRILSMGISKITTRNHHLSSNNPTKHDGEIEYYSTIEINIHSDTHFVDKNFQIL